MHKTVVWLLSLTVLAGCAQSEEGDGDATGRPKQGPDLQAASSQDYFSDAVYDASVLDLEKLSKPIYEILPPVEEFLTASDGIRLSNTVFRPDTDDPVPVYINFSPYWQESAASKGDNFGHYLVDTLVPRGYAVILAALRGTSHSEGCFEVGSDREVLDLYEVIDHYADVDWSSGAIAAGGKSYDSTTQNGLIANRPHPALKAIFHVSGITDMYSYTFRNGLLARIDGGIFTTTYSTGYGGDMTCQEFLEGVAFPASTTATGAKTPYWIERDWTRTIGASAWNGSIFFYHGFHDWNVQPAHILPWLDNLPDQIRAKTKIWLHQDRENSGHLYPMRTDWNLTMLRWLDSELKGIDTGIWKEPRAQLQGSDLLWREQDMWPDRNGSASIAIGADGLVIEATDTPLRYSGAPSLWVTVTSANPDGVFSAQLLEVDAAGVATLRNEAVMRLIYRDSLEMPSPITPALPMTFTVSFYPSDDVLPVGHKWVVAFQQTPAHAEVLPPQLLGVTVSAATLDIAIVSADPGLLALQPVGMACFAC